MAKLFSTLIFSAVIAVSAISFSSPSSSILDGQGRLILKEAQAEAALMSGQCKSYRISKNPPLVPKMKCRFS